MAPRQIVGSFSPVERVSPRRLRHAQAIAVGGKMIVLALHGDMQRSGKASKLDTAMCVCVSGLFVKVWMD
jgi:hypothetical protein